MQPGCLVQVIGKLDNRIRETLKTDAVIGTLWCWLRMEDFEVAVILENGDIWIGKKIDIKTIEVKHDAGKTD